MTSQSSVIVSAYTRLSVSYARFPQVEFPGFGCQIFPEVVMLLLTNNLERCLLGLADGCNSACRRSIG
jgi:hypothetical protein